VYRENGQKIDGELVDQVWKRYEDLEHEMENISRTAFFCPNNTTFEEFIEREKPKILQEFPEEKREDAEKAFNLMINYCRFINGDDLSRLSASLCGHYKTFPGQEMVFGKTGYMGFVDQLKKNIPAEAFRFDAEVSTVHWGNDGQVKVLCQNGDVFMADHVVITCPLGHLKHNHKQMFDPPLPEFKLGAIERTGFGRVDKLFLYYDQPFFKEGIDLAWDKLGKPDAEAGDSEWVRDIMGFEVVPTNPKVIGGPFAGQGAEIMEKLSDEEVATACTNMLRKFLNDPSIPAPTKVLRSSWISNPLFRGSYTYLSSKSHGHDICDLAAPLPNGGDPKLQFAGEATHGDYYSTIHGAYLSGVRESWRLIQLYEQ
jgi:hypothetical protein